MSKVEKSKSIRHYFIETTLVLIKMDDMEMSKQCLTVIHLVIDQLITHATVYHRDDVTSHIKNR